MPTSSETHPPPPHLWPGTRSSNSATAPRQPTPPHPTNGHVWPLYESYGVGCPVVHASVGTSAIFLTLRHWILSLQYATRDRDSLYCCAHFLSPTCMDIRTHTHIHTHTLTHTCVHTLTWNIHIVYANMQNNLSLVWLFLNVLFFFHRTPLSIAAVGGYAWWEMLSFCIVFFLPSVLLLLPTVGLTGEANLIN